MIVERRGHTDGDEIRLRRLRKVVGGVQHPLLHQFAQIAVHHVPDVVFPLVHQLHLVPLHIEPDGAEPGLGLFHRKRQAHIAQAHHAYHDLAVGDAAQQLLFEFHSVFLLHRLSAGSISTRPLCRR